jgi:uncharacterized protein (TIGR02598 family)
MKRRIRAFSLVEVVIALGIFTFCAVGIVGLLPIALDATRTVSQETNANNIADSISGFWQVAGNGANSGNDFTMGDFTIGTPGSRTLYYNNDGLQVAEADKNQASMKLAYDVQNLTGYPDTFTVNLTFSWPANAPDTSPTVNRRFFNYIFTK